MVEQEKEATGEENLAEDREIKALVNWLEKKLRKKGPIFRIYNRVTDGVKTDGKEGILSEVEELWGKGVNNFVEKNIPELCLPLFAAAALSAGNQSQESEEYLVRWRQLKEMIGLSDNYLQTGKNDLRYQGSWRMMYFATALDFFRELNREKTQKMDELGFKDKYNEKLAVPIINTFRTFFMEGEERLWLKVEERLGFMKDMPKWFRSYVGEFRGEICEGILAALCLPYFLRRFVLSINEKDERPWGYRCHQAIISLDHPFSKRVNNRATREIS